MGHMGREHHLSLFHPKLVRARVQAVPRSLFATHRASSAVWLDHLRWGALDEDLDGGRA